MISIENQPINCVARDHDFTVDAYRQLIRLALASYQIENYRSIPWGERFVIWRHDCDYSLNRSLALARIESEEGLYSTFFLNPHCEFYNLLQSDQIGLAQELLRLGHDIGLHFDAACYANVLEDELHEQLSAEADLLERFVGVRPAAFSFHNPSAFHLTCEADDYGGLINCYSKRFKTEVPYCSDSNGYWRFRRLFDVLSEANDSCLQVLTHPGWWQDRPIPPRGRIFRAAYGRAKATMSLYDQNLEAAGRENVAGAVQNIRFLKPINERLFELCDYLWNTDQLPTLLIELWRVHEGQVIRLCKTALQKDWRVPADEVDAFVDQAELVVDGWRLFRAVFGDVGSALAGRIEEVHRDWVGIRNQLLKGRGTVAKGQVAAGCVCLCGVIQSLAAWGEGQPIAYDGLAQLGSIGLPARKTADGNLTEEPEEVAGEIPAFPKKRWEAFKTDLSADKAAPAAGQGLA